MLTDCGDSENAGCIIRDPSTASYGEGFNSAGGGVWVTEFSTDAISIWFFSRPDVPSNLDSSANATSIDTSSLGTPVAHYPSTSCSISEFFQQQAIVLDISLCGVFGRAVFNETCPPTRDNACYLDWVIGPPANYSEAYFEIVSLRVFNDGTANSFSGPVIAPDVASSSSSSSGSSSSGSSGDGTDSSGDNGLSDTGAGGMVAAWSWNALAALVLGAAGLVAL